MDILRLQGIAYLVTAFMVDNPGASLDDRIVSFSHAIGYGLLSSDEQCEVRRMVERELAFRDSLDHAEVEDPSVVTDPEHHIDWYADWMVGPGCKAYYWPRLMEFLGSDLRVRFGDAEAGRVVRSIGVASDVVLNLLEDPSRTEFATKGLVLGHVQSGKTANFTAVIAKAVDAGYRLIIVLTGIHEILRRQTQQRLDRELTGEVEDEALSHVLIPANEHRQFVRLTSRKADFFREGQRPLRFLAGNRNPVIAVIKKNCRVLQRLLTWITSASDEARASLPALIIDDEADLASIDINSNKGTTPSNTNALIRAILGSFPKTAYVGYTATPFANVLIRCDSLSAELGRDLYPRNFIVSLPRPTGYFGGDEMFPQGSSSPFIREVPDAEAHLLRPSTRRPFVVTSLPATLHLALSSFLLAGATRLARGQGGEPMTMLVHTSQSQAAHRTLYNLLDQALAGLRGRMAYERASLLRELRNLWMEDFVPTSDLVLGTSDWHALTFDDIEPHIASMLLDVTVLELNSASFDQLDYTDTPNIKAIAVGGNKLSRGLTLEGLLVSYYLRQSGAYDTLLQMGRWFGYRRDYVDLTRVFTTATLADQFSDLATVERELRDDIRRYEDEGATPAELAVKIRAHATLAVTAPCKMGAGGPIQSSYSGRIVQTIWLPLDDQSALSANLCAAADLASKHEYTRVPTGWLSRSVPVASIMGFLKAYSFVSPRRDGGEGPLLDPQSLLAYIDRQVAAGELQTWNVLVKSLEVRPDAPRVPELNCLGDVVPVTRSRHSGTKYKVGVITDPADLKCDLPAADDARRTHPLLVIYPISRRSAPRCGSDSQARGGIPKLVPLFEDLPATHDVIGIAVTLPPSASEPYNYIGQTL